VLQNDAEDEWAKYMLGKEFAHNSWLNNLLAAIAQHMTLQLDLCCKPYALQIIISCKRLTGWSHQLPNILLIRWRVWSTKQFENKTWEFFFTHLDSCFMARPKRENKSSKVPYSAFLVLFGTYCDLRTVLYAVSPTTQLKTTAVQCTVQFWTPKATFNFVLSNVACIIAHILLRQALLSERTSRKTDPCC
jgi:hypothetical protein